MRSSLHRTPFSCHSSFVPSHTVTQIAKMNPKANSEKKRFKVNWHVGKLHKSILPNVCKANKLRSYAEW